MVNIPIWPSSSDFIPGNTPFGFYDNDYQLQIDGNRESIDGWEWFDEAPQ